MANPTAQADRLIWIDLEMTGLDPARERIIEVATLVTDGDLNLIAEGPVLAVHQPDSLLEAMDEWNTRTHGESGLVKRVKESQIDTAEAERQTLEFLARHVAAGASPMCGNSVHQDRRFLQHGALDNVWVARNPPGFAFITYEDERDAEECVRQINQMGCGRN